MAVAAYVLIKVAPGKPREVAQAISQIKYTQHTHALTGPYDVITMIEAPDLVTIGETVVTKLQTIPGVHETLTCLVID
ncbi:MAG: Lrp/AsnC ligand binding domain-containing protein [Chloroflexi bacterium]|nr:Lrp/AsnC ligand binding domain-containing protein [Chloroflexota bacterium]MCL5074755.1 Lrp/AsnC ligand binding domain-containing protein [Chloroflexota bacterium]